MYPFALEFLAKLVLKGKKNISTILEAFATV